MANIQLPNFITAENELDGNEPVYIAQSGKTRKTTIQKIKDFILGTATLLTTDQTIKGAINEVRSSLSEKAQNTDNTRTTTAKDVTGAINELNIGKVAKTSIVNNLTATVAGSVLDATQGKALNEKIPILTKIYPTFTNGTATVSYTGVTSSSVAMVNWNHGSSVYVTSVVCNANTITITVSDTNVNGTINAILLLKI